MMMPGMQQRDAKSAPQETFSSTRQLPVRAALNAQISTLPFNCRAGFTTHGHIISKSVLFFKHYLPVLFSKAERF